MARPIDLPGSGIPVGSAWCGAPVYLIGLDACEPTLLLEWASRGILPHSQRLLERGVSATVADRSPILASASTTFPHG